MDYGTQTYLYIYIEKRVYIFVLMTGLLQLSSLSVRKQLQFKYLIRELREQTPEPPTHMARSNTWKRQNGKKRKGNRV